MLFVAVGGDEAKNTVDGAENDESSRCVGEIEIAEEREESISNAGNEEKCVNEVARAMCVRRRVKHTLSDMFGVRKLATRERLSSLLVYNLTAGQTRAENDTELGEKLRSKTGEG